MHVLYTGAHGGFDTSRLPLGGGAAVMDALVREWARTKPFPLTVLGVGQNYDLPGVRFERLPVALAGSLTDMGERDYARFCRSFERAATDWIRGQDCDTARTIVLCNDISEGPTFRTLAGLGLSIATIFHVDVVEYVAKFYGQEWFRPETLTRLYRGVERLGVRTLAPDVLRLIFEKQQDCVRHSTALIVPSRGMAEVLRRCYPGCDHQIEVLPWEAIRESDASSHEERPTQDLQAEFGIGQNETVLLTLCRISPEKGIDRLLEALCHWERDGVPALRVFVCGAPAFMQGQRYAEKLRRLARRLRRTRVHFVGHVGRERKAAFFARADLYVHLSYHESYGLTLAEAMRAGCPVLTTDHHSARDLVPPTCGRIVSGRTGETVGALRELLADRARLQEMRRAAAEHAKNLDFSRAAARLADILKDAIRTHALRGH